HDCHIGGIGTGPPLLDPHRLLAWLGAMYDPFPVDVLQVALLAGTHKADRRHVGFLAVVEDKLAPTAARVEVLPAHQASAPRRLAIHRDDLDLLADEIGRKHGSHDVAPQATWPAFPDR